MSMFNNRKSLKIHKIIKIVREELNILKRSIRGLKIKKLIKIQK